MATIPSKIVSITTTIPPFMVIQNPDCSDFVVYIKGVAIADIDSFCLRREDGSMDTTYFAGVVQQKLRDNPDLQDKFSQAAANICLGTFHIRDSEKSAAVQSMANTTMVLRNSTHPAGTPIELTFVRKPDSWPNHAASTTGIPWIWLHDYLGDSLSPPPTCCAKIHHHKSDIVDDDLPTPAPPCCAKTHHNHSSDMVGIFGPPTRVVNNPGLLDPKESCASCGVLPRADLRLKKCAGCMQANYCDRACQKAHWKVHKKVCAKMAAVETAAETIAAEEME